MKYSAALFFLSLSARAVLAMPSPDVLLQPRGCVGTCWDDNNFKGFVKCVPACVLGEDKADDLSSSEEEDNEVCSDKCFRQQDEDPNAAKTPGGFTAYDQEAFETCLNACYKDKGIIDD